MKRMIIAVLLASLIGCMMRERFAAGHVGLLGIGLINMRLTNQSTRLEDVRLIGIVGGNLYRGVVIFGVTNGVTNVTKAP